MLILINNCNILLNIKYFILKHYHFNKFKFLYILNTMIKIINYIAKKLFQI